MARINTQHYKSENLSFNYVVNVDKEGNFSTTLPSEVIEKMKVVGISFGFNRMNNEGYFISESLNSLIEKVEASADKYSAKELTDDKIILKYSVDTTCHYCKSEGVTGDIVPNGGWVKDYDKKGKWFEGSTGTHAMDNLPYGFSCYVEPMRVKVWKFPDGETQKEYVRLSEEDYRDDETLFWLNSLVHMDKRGGIKEIDYTPKLGSFFKGLILYICNINEKILSIFGEENRFDLTKIGNKDIALLSFKEK
jgi:hypothetical protein